VIKIDTNITPSELSGSLDTLFSLSGDKIRLLDSEWNPEKGTPVFTVKGKYTSRGWTEWTQGFQYGNALYQYDATGDEWFLRYGRRNTVEKMSPHLTHVGVHDHGFNNVSTYGNLLRLMTEKRIEENFNEREFYRLALKVTGAVQASRWTDLPDGRGYVPSFNGPHSLFSDTIRSMRALAAAYLLGQHLSGEQDANINLLYRLLQHADTTAFYNVYYGNGRDSYDERGRVVHESIFNTKSGAYRCPSTQQGYSPFSTWTRGLSWIVCGYAEELEFLEILSPDEISGLEYPHLPDMESVKGLFLKAAKASADFFIENTPSDGIPYWDTGAPGLHNLGDYLSRPADPFNQFEPVDSSAAAITAQGLLRLGRYLKAKGEDEPGDRYFQAGLTAAKTLLDEPYLSADPSHHGILLHSIYHRPNGWDYIPPESKVPHGESCMWGDYHLMELAVYLKRMAEEKDYLTFFNIGAR